MKQSANLFPSSPRFLRLSSRQPRGRERTDGYQKSKTLKLCSIPMNMENQFRLKKLEEMAEFENSGEF